MKALREKAVDYIMEEVRRETRSIQLTEVILGAAKDHKGKAGKRFAGMVQKKLDEFAPNQFTCKYREPYNFSSELVILDIKEHEAWKAESDKNRNSIWCTPNDQYGRWETRWNLKAGFDKGVPDWDREEFIKSNACHYTAAMERNKRRASDIVDGTLDKWLNAKRAVELANEALENTDEPESKYGLERELFK